MLTMTASEHEHRYTLQQGATCRCGVTRQQPAPPLYDPARLADLEALREVTEGLTLAREPYIRHYLTAKAETILRRLREDKPAPTLRDIEEGRAVSL